MISDLKRLESLEIEWEEIERRYRTSPYNAPLNREEERQKVIEAYRRGQPYQPQFVYAQAPEYPVEQIRQFMATLTPDASPLERLYYENARNELLTIQSVQTHAPEVITASSCLIDGLPDTALIAEAWKILQNVPPTSDAEPSDIPAEQAAAQMQKVIDASGLPPWKAVVFEPMNAQMSVNRKDKELRIRKGSACSTKDLHRLIVHEIGVHILRYENGARQSIRLFRNSFPGYGATEEGLAVYSETRAGLLKTDTLRKYAGRVIAAHLALSQSFSEVFATLAAELGEEEAFSITVRAKRGFTDTAQPGAHVKDLIYLQGYLAVKAHLEQHQDDYPLLFLGKFGLQHLPIVRALLNDGLISSPTLLPDNLQKEALDH